MGHPPPFVASVPREDMANQQQCSFLLSPDAISDSLNTCKLYTTVINLWNETLVRSFLRSDFGV